MFKTLHNLGYSIEQLPPETVQTLRNMVQDVLKNLEKATPHNLHLAGHIQHEYLLTEAIPLVEPIVMKMIKEYELETGFISSIKRKVLGGKDLKLETLWVNFQTANEFNPVHHHGGLFSFVIWLQIPYKIEEETALFHVKQNRSSCFEFIYNDILGNIRTHTFAVGTKDEGIIVLFPAGLHHCVYPFMTSEDIRISISGNIDFN
jgi:hypothetical protein